MIVYGYNVTTRARRYRVEVSMANDWGGHEFRLLPGEYPSYDAAKARVAALMAELRGVPISCPSGQESGVNDGTGPGGRAAN